MGEEKKEKIIKFCPFCGCSSVLAEGEYSALCPRCATLVFAFSPEGPPAEKWYDIPGYGGAYQVSSHLHVRHPDGKPVRTYFKGNSLYCTLYRGRAHRERSVRQLLFDAMDGGEDTDAGE